MNDFIIRVAKSEDASSIQAIYEHYVQHTAITFDYGVPSLESIQEQIEETLIEYPYIVCELDKKVIGYAYAHPHMQKAAYQWNAVLTVYLDKEYTGFKIGQAFYHALIEILALQNFINVYACVTRPNPKSEKLHADFGFKTIGVFEKAGFKNGRWFDVIWLEKKLQKDMERPKTLIPFSEINHEVLIKLLEKKKEYIAKYRN